jgi:hypothetical protein
MCGCGCDVCLPQSVVCVDVYVFVHNFKHTHTQDLERFTLTLLLFIGGQLHHSGRLCSFDTKRNALGQNSSIVECQIMVM